MAKGVLVPWSTGFSVYNTVTCASLFSLNREAQVIAFKHDSDKSGILSANLFPQHICQSEQFLLSAPSTMVVAGHGFRMKLHYAQSRPLGQWLLGIF